MLSSDCEIGPPMPKKNWGHSMIQLRGDIFIIGGNAKQGGYQQSIHRLRCSSGDCNWTTMTQMLQVKRGQGFVAMPISDEIVSCKQGASFYSFIFLKSSYFCRDKSRLVTNLYKSQW